MLKKAREILKYAEMRHDMMTSLNITMTSHDDYARELNTTNIQPSRDSQDKINIICGD